MANAQGSDAGLCQVVVNDEEQYSIWPDDRTPPLGWRSVKRGLPKPECLAYIESVWTDMRPRSLRVESSKSR